MCLVATGESDLWVSSCKPCYGLQSQQLHLLNSKLSAVLLLLGECTVGVVAIASLCAPVPSAKDVPCCKTCLRSWQLHLLCRGLGVKVKYAGVANNAVKAAFQSAGFRRTSKAHWNVLWSKALKPEAYSGLTKFQRVCSVAVWACCAGYGMLLILCMSCCICHAVHARMCLSSCVRCAVHAVHVVLCMPCCACRAVHVVLYMPCCACPDVSAMVCVLC